MHSLRFDQKGLEILEPAFERRVKRALILMMLMSKRIRPGLVRIPIMGGID